MLNLGTVSTTSGLVELGSTATSFKGSNVTESVTANFTPTQNLTFENNSSNTTDGLSIGGTVAGSTGQLTLDGASTATMATGFQTVFSQTVTESVPMNVVSSNISVPTVVKNGAGSWELKGNNTFTSLAVNSGTVAFTSATSLGSGSISLGTAGSSGTTGTLQFAGLSNITVANNITIHGNGTFSGTGDIYLASGSLTINGSIKGDGSAYDSNLNIASADVTLTNSVNTYTGSTNIYGGSELAEYNGGLLPSGTVVNLGTSGETSDKFDYFAIAGDQTIAALNSVGGGGSGVTNLGGYGQIITLTISGVNTDGQAVNSSFGGIMEDGPGSEISGYDTTAIKVAGGTVTFTGNQNSYVGGTTIAGGTFFANNTSGSATGVGNVSVTAGGTLRGSGIIAMTAQVNGIAVPAAIGMTVADGGLIHPGTAADGDVAQNYLTFSLSPVLSRILEFQAETSRTAQMEFTLGGGAAPTDASGLTFAGSSSFIKLATDGVGEVKFDGNLLQIDDLTDGGLDLNGSYLLFSGGLNSDYAGLTTDSSGKILSGLALTGTDAARYQNAALFLTNGDIMLEVPEPSEWLLFACGLGVLALAHGGVRRRTLLSRG